MPFLKNWSRLYTYMTEPEKALEPAIAALGTRYRVQHPFWDLHHFADFVLLDRMVVVEVDGKSHDAPAQKVKDLKHTLALQAKGYTVVRCRNEEALSRPTETVARLLDPAQIARSILPIGETLLEIARLEAQIAAKTRKRRPAPSPKAGKGRRKRATKGALDPML